jgi:methionyl-tRNA synthetase
MQTKAPTSASGSRRYITTAIPYVNAAPHLGFALEMIQADTLARFYRLCGDDVRFQTGTDENSIKNVQAADEAFVSVPELVERNAARFLALKESLDLSFDDFIRTSTDTRHTRGAERLWQACSENGDVYKRPYRGLYCTGCEQFYKPSELHEGRCPEHGTVPDEIQEENWFFRLSRYRHRLCDLYARGEIEIIPQSRRNEVFAWIDGELEDFSISRSAGRARGWGIAVPGDPDQVIYVWFDALGNYITGLGYGTDATLLSRFWTEASSREHVIGKGITFQLVCPSRLASLCTAMSRLKAARLGSRPEMRLIPLLWLKHSASMRCAITCCAISARPAMATSCTSASGRLTTPSLPGNWEIWRTEC